MSAILSDLVYDPKLGRDIAVPLPFAYFPKAYATKEAAAKGLYDALKKVAVEMGQAESEVMLLDPEKSAKYGTGRNWRVCWEAGPFEWAIRASFEIAGPWGYTEPYYSFDLCFTD